MVGGVSKYYLSKPVRLGGGAGVYHRIDNEADSYPSYSPLFTTAPPPIT